jgi:hypothetical protein
MGCGAFLRSQDLVRQSRRLSILRNTKVHHHVYKSPPPVCILSQMNPLHTLLYCLRTGWCSGNVIDCIREVPGSSLGRDTLSWLRLFVIFFIPQANDKTAPRLVQECMFSNSLTILHSATILPASAMHSGLQIAHTKNWRHGARRLVRS